ncbi:MAG TPA: hypothetical protein VHB77_00525 [Planctomycetaceae bacterium]|nr:hypothetical protein [Planctomycetaceae bacterium]
MRISSWWLAAGLLACAALPGCSAGSQIVRGQTPADVPAAYAQGGDYCPPGAMGGAMGGPMGAYDGAMGGYDGAMGGYGGGPVQVPGGYAYPGPVYAGTPGSVAYGPMPGVCRYPIPRQYYRMRYCVPQGLQYPPAGQPPAVVQYPYYTCKGPDDFFYTGK